VIGKSSRWLAGNIGACILRFVWKLEKMVVIKFYVATLMGVFSLMLMLSGLQCNSSVGARLSLFSTVDVCGAPG